MWTFFAFIFLRSPLSESWHRLPAPELDLAFMPGMALLPGLALACLAGTFFCSCVSVLMFWWDKRAAQLQRRRIAERTLQIWALLGGWPGAFWARHRFRHKSQKQPFSTILWGTACLNVLAWGAVFWFAGTR